MCSVVEIYDDVAVESLYETVISDNEGRMHGKMLHTRYNCQIALWSWCCNSHKWWDWMCVYVRWLNDSNETLFGADEHSIVGFRIEVLVQVGSWSIWNAMEHLEL